MQEAIKKTKYTYADYYSWDDGERYELIEGVPYLMAPAPSDGHQSVCVELVAQLAVFLRNKPCKVRAAPYDVRLNADGADDTVVQPDIVVICDSSKITARGCVGAPDLAIEILSESSHTHDAEVKYRLYLKAGVREYWIVDPVRQTVKTNILVNSQYKSRMYNRNDIVSVHVLEGCAIRLPEVFSG